MNLPNDTLQTIENAGELLLQGIDAERAKLKHAIKVFDDFHASISKHLSVIREVRNGKINSDNRGDDRSRISDAVAWDLEEYKRSGRLPNP